MMGRSVAPGQSGFGGYGSSSGLFGGGQDALKPSPGAGGRPTVPGGPRLPQNPIANHAWQMQKFLGAMQPPYLRVGQVKKI
jgi:hypothetical protein